MQHASKIIGLLGGMSWESSALYYRLLNDAANRKLGGHHYARSILYSFDFDELLSRATAGRWEEVGDMLRGAALQVKAAGAEFLLITAVTGHAVAERVEKDLGIPLLHVADPTAEAIKKAGLSRVGLMATRFTMEMDFLTSRLRGRHGIDCLVPEAEDRTELHRIIVEELTLGIVKETSQETARRMAGKLVAKGAQGIIVGCTELPLLLKPEDYPAPAFDAVQLHVDAAIAMATS